MKYHILILVLSAFSSFAQIDKKAIKTQAEQTAEALMKDDYETMLKFTYPTVVDMIGGRDKFITVVKQGKDGLAQQGITIMQVTMGEPGETVKAGDEIHCLVPQTLILKLENGKLKSESHLLAISNDQGKNWYFVDTAQLTADNIKIILPNFNNDLKLPEKTQPQFIPD
jgi:hypothetical protein